MIEGSRRIGIGLVDPRHAPNMDDIGTRLRRAAEDGFSSAWIDHAFGWDALTTLAVLGARVPEIELGTSVVPIYSRHPIALAQQAMTTSALVGPRLTLGIGTSHKIVVEECFGLSFERPADYTEDYLRILLPLLGEGAVDHAGERLRGNIRLRELGTENVPVLLAALGPRMLQLAGAVASGTILWLANDGALREYVVPTVQAAADAAGQPAPRIVCALPVCVTEQIERARADAARTFRLYERLPSYRQMLDRSHAPGPEDASIIGDEDAVVEQVDALFAAGATDIVPALIGTPDELERGWQVFAGISRSLAPVGSG